MVLITVSGIAVGPTGPTGSSVERAILTVMPKGTAATVLGAVTMTFGLILVLGAWLVLGLLLRRGAEVKPLYRIACIWSAPLLIGPPIFSRDLYSYAADGLMVNRHISPYEFGPAALGAIEVPRARQSRVARHAVAVRTALPAPRERRGAAVGRQCRQRPIMLLRLLEVAGVVLIAVSLPALARAAGKDPARAVWLGVCNPLDPVPLHRRRSQRRAR